LVRAKAYVTSFVPGSEAFAPNGKNNQKSPKLTLCATAKTRAPVFPHENQKKQKTGKAASKQQGANPPSKKAA